MLVVGFNGASPFLEVGNSSQIGGRGVMDSYMMVDMIVMKRARVESISLNGNPSNPGGYFHTISNP